MTQFTPPPPLSSTHTIDSFSPCMHFSGHQTSSAKGRSSVNSPAWTSHVTASTLATPPAPFMHSVPLPISSSNISYTGSQLHPVLESDRTGRLYFNIMNSPDHIQFKPNYPNNLRGLAHSPAVSRLTIAIPTFPRWTIEVANPAGVTLGDVLWAIYNKFQQPVDQSAYGMLSPEQQQVATQTFHARLAHQDGHSQGLRRFDCVGKKLYFVGLRSSSDGSPIWNLMLTSTFA
ncbi:hypothetical protein BD779DRAFT_211589 [Infundibulicybe gibba]|nr:hypothetical protein BD779DRAFT_211589 [Infundibulicybe gibba]